MSAGGPPDDRALVMACLDGDESAWRALVARYQRLVHAIALRCGLDDAAAADVFQTVFEKLHRNLAQLHQPDRLSAWISTTARREAIRLSRLRKRDAISGPGETSGVVEQIDESALPDQDLEDLQRLGRLRNAMDQLDGRCRELLTALFLADGDDASYESVADELGMPVGSLGPTRARCLEKLRRIMNET